MATTQAIKERPVLFSGAMVRAILEGRKTITRRVCQLACDLSRDHHRVRVRAHADGTWTLSRDAMHTPGVREPFILRCPYGSPGDLLWVREAWAETEDEYDTPLLAYAAGGARIVGRDEDGRDHLIDGTHGQFVVDRWRPSIHMPRWASRLTLRIEDVRVERLQEISREDAIAEGVPTEPYEATVNGQPGTVYPMDPVYQFSQMWQHINGKRPGCGWADNPFCWCITFSKIER